MKSFRVVQAGLFVAALLLSLITSTSVNIILPASPDSHFIPSSTRVYDFFADPNITSEPNCTIVGSSSEFSWSYNSHNASFDLVWTHTAGTPLGWPASDQAGPDCLDYVKLSQSARWSESVQPDNVRAIIDAQVNITGDFESDAVGWEMFECTLFARTGTTTPNWFRILRLPRLSNYNETYDLSIPDITILWNLIFGDMESSIAEFEIILALSPTHEFLEYLGEAPWREMDGTVTYTFQKLAFGAMVVESCRDEELTSPVHEFHYVPEDCNLSISGIVAGANSVLGIATQYESSSTVQLLLKWTASLDLKWSHSWAGDGKAIGMGIALGDESAYSTGITRVSDTQNWRVYLCKYDLDGNLQWVRYWGSCLNGYNSDVIVGSDGAVYVFSYLRVGTMDMYHDAATRSILRKYNQSGNLIWERIVYEGSLNLMYESPYPSIGVGLALSDTALYCLEHHRLSKWLTNGTAQWNFRPDIYFSWEMCPIDVQVNENGNILTTQFGGLRTGFIWNYEGTLVHELSNLIQFGNCWTLEPACRASVHLGNNTNVFLYDQGYGSVRQATAFDSFSSQVWRMNLSSPITNFLCTMDISDDNILYLLESYGEEQPSMELKSPGLTIKSYLIHGDAPTLMISPFIIGVPIGMTIVAIVFLIRERRQP